MQKYISLLHSQSLHVALTVLQYMLVHQEAEDKTSNIFYLFQSKYEGIEHVTLEHIQ